MMASKVSNRKILAMFVGTFTIFCYVMILAIVSFQNIKYHKTLKERLADRENNSNFLNTKSVIFGDQYFSKTNKSLKNAQAKRLPKCLIIGFSKCGTTALRGFLTLHPSIVSPLREIRYFTLNYEKGLEWYRNQMPVSSPDQITLEKSAGYIASLESLERIRRMDPGMKLVVMVRDPIVRLQSEFARCVSKNTGKTSTFKSWCRSAHSPNVLRLIDFATPLSNVYRLFPRNQVLVLSEELLEERPIVLLKEVETFLDLKPAFSKSDLVYDRDKGFYCFNTSSTKFPKVKTSSSIVFNERTGCLGSHKGRAHPEVDREFLEELITVAQPYNQRLFRLIGKKFTWANFKDR